MTEPGEVLAGRYRLVELLGRGGMGSVWRAEHVELGSQVAVKLIAEGIATSETALGRFRREAKAAAALSSPHVVQIFDYGVDKDVPYIAMELLHGESLAQRLKVRRTLPQAELARLLTHVARAIDKAHRAGILHRDMKPDNVFICKGEDEDDEETVKVLDFGVAKALKPDVVGTLSSHTRTGALVGSPYYMSPEQIRGQKTIDHHGDLWSIGVITYECLIGKRPFEGESIGDLVMTVCSDPIPVPSERGCKLAGFDGWFAQACARDPKERFASAREMANAFRALMGQGVLDEETRDSVEESMAGPPMATTLEESATVPAAAPFAAADTPPTAAAGAATAATGVQTASGLTRTHDGPNGPRRPALGSRVGLALGAGVLVAGVAVAALLISRAGNGDRGSAASSAGPAESAVVSSVPAPTRPEPLPSATAAAPSSASGSSSSAPSAAVPSSIAPKSKVTGDAAHAAAPATAAPKSPPGP
jgi:eukaryotic-like serine/threonine-protein kinase